MRLVKMSVCTLMFVAGLVPTLAHTANETPQSLRGNWTALKAMRGGSAVDDVVGHRLSFSGDRFEIRSRDGKPLYAGTFRLTPGTKPDAIDFQHAEGDLKGKAWKGIYELKSDTLTICDNAENLDKPRPTAFEAAKGSGYILITFTRTRL